MGRSAPSAVGKVSLRARFMTGGARLSEQLKNPLDDGEVASQLRAALAESLPRDGAPREGVRAGIPTAVSAEAESAATSQSLFPQQSNELAFERLRTVHTDLPDVPSQLSTRVALSAESETIKTAATTVRSRGRTSSSVSRGGLLRGRYGFSGVTILDRFANALLDALRGILQLVGRLFGIRSGAYQKSGAPKRTHSQLAAKEALLEHESLSDGRKIGRSSNGKSPHAKRARLLERYFPKRSL